MEINVLGTVEAVADGGQPIHFSGKSAILLTLLTLARPMALRKDFLHEAIWNGSGSANVVESVVRSIRQKIGRDETGLLVTRSSSYRLDAATDLEAFRDLADTGMHRYEIGDFSGALSSYEHALALWRGDLSQPENTDLTAHMFEAVERSRRDVSLRRLRTLVALGRDGQVLQDVGGLLAREPFWEEVQAIRVGASYRYEGVHAAAAIIKEVGDSFAEEGLTVSPDWNALVTGILTHQDGSASLSADVILTGAGAVAEQGRVDPEPASVSGEHRTYDNLPPATYSKFVMRPGIWKRMEAAVVQDLPIISLIGIGGTGKSTLAREFCKRNVLEGGHFAGVIWVSDKERPGTLTEQAVLDTVAYTMEYQGIIALEPLQKRREIIRLMRRIPILLVIDNYESLTDSALAQWLAEIPEPSKVLLTSIRRSGIPEHLSYEIKIDGLGRDEVIQFYDQCIQRMGLSEIVTRRSDLMSLWQAADGNPRLIEWALGQAKRRGRRITDLVHEFSEPTAVDSDGISGKDVFLTDLFRSSWTVMSHSAKVLLLAMAYLPYGAATEMVKQITGQPSDLEDGLEEISDLCFVSRLAVPDSADSWHLVNPLVSSRRNVLHITSAAEVKERWLRYWTAFAESIGFCPGDVDRLRKLDFEINRKNLEYAVSWCMKNERYHEAIRITRGVRYFYYVRGLWSISPNPHLIRARAAQATGDIVEEFDALVYHFNILGKQESVADAEVYRERLQQILAEESAEISPAARADYSHALALHLLAKGECQKAEDVWLENLRKVDLLGPANYNANKRWYAICLKRMGRDRFEEARQLFHECREQAVEIGHRRAVVLIDLQLAELRLDTIGYLDDVPAVLDDLQSMNPVIAELSDRRYEADHHWLLGRCYRRLGHTNDADLEFGMAAELYQRLGLVDRAAAARNGGLE